MDSASELEYQLLLAFELGMLDRECWIDLTRENALSRRMLSALIGKLKGSPEGGTGRGIPPVPKSQ